MRYDKNTKTQVKLTLNLSVITFIIRTYEVFLALRGINKTPESERKLK